MTGQRKKKLTFTNYQTLSLFVHLKSLGMLKMVRTPPELCRERKQF
jgi:hypothetical protein